MSSEKHPNLQLHKWAPTDYVRREEWNDNFGVIDDKIGILSRKQRKVDVVEDFGADSTGVQDSTSQLINAIEYAKNNKVREIVFNGNFKISGALPVYSNLTYVMKEGSITQTSANTAIFKGDTVSNTEWLFDDFELVGKGNDFVEAYGREAVGILLNATVGANTNIKIKNAKIKQCTHAGIQIFKAYNCRFEDNEITGTFVDGVDNGKNYQFGICLNDAPTNCFIERNTITKTAQGVLVGKNFDNVHLDKNIIKDIVGQHGFYLDYGKRLKVTRNIVENINLQGIKVQIDDSATSDTYDVLIENNTISKAGSHAVLITNVAVTPTFKTRKVQIKGNIIDGDATNLEKGAGIRINHAYDVVITKNNVSNNQYGLYVENSDEVISDGNKYFNLGRNGLYVINTSFKSFKDFILNPGQTPSTTYEQGIYVNTDKEFIIDGVTVDDTTDKMTYSLICSNVVTGQNLSIRNCKLLKKSVRFHTTSTTTLKEFDNNEIVGFYINYYPSAVVKGRKSQVFHSPSMPTTGSYIKGDYVENTNPTVQGTAGSKYVIYGWKRLTTGSNHVLNTDWVEDRRLTGN
jgi:nitrous oxidase accessory protein NosD